MTMRRPVGRHIRRVGAVGGGIINNADALHCVRAHGIGRESASATAWADGGAGAEGGRNAMQLAGVGADAWMCGGRLHEQESAQGNVMRGVLRHSRRIGVVKRYSKVGGGADDLPSIQRRQFGWHLSSWSLPCAVGINQAAHGTPMLITIYCQSQ